MLRQSTHLARRLRVTRLKVAALARGAGRVGKHSARGRVAARVVAVVLQPAVTLLARLNEAVAAHRAVEERARLVTQAVVHPVLEGQGEVLEAAGGPEVRLHGGGGGRHDAPLLWALAVVRVVLHAKVVPHLVGHGGGHETDDLAVPHAHPARELVGADGTF